MSEIFPLKTSSWIFVISLHKEIFLFIPKNFCKLMRVFLILFGDSNIIDKGNNILYQSDLVVKHHYTNNGATWKGVG